MAHCGRSAGAAFPRGVSTAPMFNSPIYTGIPPLVPIPLSRRERRKIIKETRAWARAPTRHPACIVSREKWNGARRRQADPVLRASLTNTRFPFRAIRRTVERISSYTLLSIAACDLSSQTAPVAPYPRTRLISVASPNGRPRVSIDPASFAKRRANARRGRALFANDWIIWPIWLFHPPRKMLRATPCRWVCSRPIRLYWSGP